MDGYPELRDKISASAHRHGYRLDWTETNQLGRLLLIWDVNGVNVARVWLPYKPTKRIAAEIVNGLEPIFGKDWNL